MITRELTTLVVAVVLAATGCSRPATDTAPTAPDLASPPAPTSAPARQGVPNLPLGASVEISTPAGTASYTVANWRPVPPDAQIIPAKGAMYSVDVTVEARSGTTTVNGFYFAVLTADGGSIAPAVGAVRPGITYGQLAQGESVSGHVAFDLAPGTAVTGLGLRDPGGKPLALWTISG